MWFGDSCQGRIQEVALRGGGQWVINFCALDQSWRMSTSPPPHQFGAPEVSSLELVLALEWRPARHVDLPIFSCLPSFLPFSFFIFLSLFFSFPLSFPFPLLLFWRPFSDSGGRGHQSPQDTALVVPMNKNLSYKRNKVNLKWQPCF